MKSISELFQSRRQHELSGFVIYIVTDGPADGTTPVPCIALDGENDALRPALLCANCEAGEYELTVLLDAFGSLRETEFDRSATVGGMRCIVDRYEPKFVRVTGTPDPAVFRADRKKVLHFGRLA